MEEFLWILSIVLSGKIIFNKGVNNCGYCLYNGLHVQKLYGESIK